MTTAELLVFLRSQLDDITEPYLWSDPELITYIAEAEREAAVRGRLLQTTEPVYTEIPVTAGTAVYSIDPIIFEVTRAYLGTTVLKRASIGVLDETDQQWETATGTPNRYMLNGSVLTLYPNPEESGTLKLRIARLPVELGTSPEIPAMYHIRMLDWAKNLAYSKRDADANDEGLAEKFKNRFDESFGSYSSAGVYPQGLLQEGFSIEDPRWL